MAYSLLHLILGYEDNSCLFGLGYSFLLSKAAPGSLDPTFNTTFNGFITKCFPLPNGKALIWGNYTNADESIGDRFSRLNTDGSIDDSFVGGTGPSGGIAHIYSFARQSDGKILLGGTFTNFNGVARNGLVRLNPDGDVDLDFAPGGLFGGVYATAVQSDGKVLVGGPFALLSRFNSDGTKDQSFNPTLDGAGAVNAITIQPDGKILLAGSFLTVPARLAEG